MAKNNLPVWHQKKFSVHPEPVEGRTEKFHPAAAIRSYFDSLSTNGLPHDFAISGSYF
ncbi:MAG: hypothetical protein HOP23_07240 [Methylococcaceae bacterium]|nr:hypothetical protein [Methylococcaceae bacterium]